jgi:O-antigen/teichoic acid export membrane protein
MRVRLGFLGNAAIASAGAYVEFAVALPLSIIVARSLGPSDFGHYTFAIWLTGWLVTASNNALTMTSIKFIAEARGTAHPGVANHLAHRVATLQARSTLAVLATFCVAALLYVPGDWSGPNGWLMVAIAVVTVWARAGGWLMGAIGKGFEKFTVESVAPVVATSCGLSLVLILSWLHGSVTQFFAAFAVAGLVMNLSARVTLRRCGVHITPGDIPRPLYQRFWKQLLLTGALIVVNLCANRTIETLFLKAYSTPMNLGFFALAGTLTKGAVDFLAGGLSAVLLPAMARTYGRGQGHGLSNMLSEAIRFYWYLGLLISGFGVLVTDDIVTLLYGARYAAAIPAVTVTIIASGLLTWGAAINAYQTTSDLQQDRIWIASLTLLVNIIVALALIPRYGLAGAVGSFAVTRTAGLTISWLFLRRRLALQLPLLPMSKALLATAAAVGVSMLVDQRLHGPGRPLAGALCFLLAFVFLTVVSRVYYRRDFELGAALCGRLGPAGRRFAARVLAVAPRFAADR